LLAPFKAANHTGAKGERLKDDSVQNYAGVINNLFKHEHLHSLDELINLSEADILGIAERVKANYFPNCNPPLPRGPDSRHAMRIFGAWYRETQHEERKQPTRCVGGPGKNEYLPACHECAKPVKAGEERSDCVFEDFRMLHGNNVTEDLYAVAADSAAVADDTVKMDVPTAEFVIRHAAPALLAVLDREIQFLEQAAEREPEPKVRERGRGYRELCDVCLTSIFNLRCAALACSPFAGRRVGRVSAL
jgi:hypothetical protein